MRRILCFLLFALGANCQTDGLWVDFGTTVRPWDGFGVNYVEVAQTRDYRKWPQEYGGFSTLSEQQRSQILDLIFGADGLKPGLVKMFLDPYQEGLTESDKGKFDHKTTTQWMRYFVREGLARTRARGSDLEIITTMYGPPPWTTQQRFVRGRDLDQARKEDVAEYMIAWVKFLRDEEGFPVRYVSLHNEGEEFYRWPSDGSTAGEERHDFNLYWHSSQVVDFLRFMRPMMDRQGLRDVGLTPGETSSWRNFALTGISWAINSDPEALKNLGLITSHGFGDISQNIGASAELLRIKRPDLHAWTTSMSWGKMDVSFVESIRQQIYRAQVNGMIPWAAIQTATWIGGDPNPGTAFRVDGKGGYTVEPGYYFYKQVSRAGLPGMAVASVSQPRGGLGLMAFAANGTKQPDAFVVLNTSSAPAKARIRVTGTAATRFSSFVTDDAAKYRAAGDVPLADGWIECEVPSRGVMTFFAAPR